MAKARTIRFTVNTVKFFDTYGNTYHSVRITRVRDGAVLVGALQYGYGEQYRQTALNIMRENKWIPKRFRADVYSYERLANYPIQWTVTDGLKRDCVANGEI